MTSSSHGGSYRRSSPFSFSAYCFLWKFSFQRCRFLCGSWSSYLQLSFYSIQLGLQGQSIWSYCGSYLRMLWHCTGWKPHWSDFLRLEGQTNGLSRKSWETSRSSNPLSQLPRIAVSKTGSTALSYSLVDFFLRLHAMTTCTEMIFFTSFFCPNRSYILQLDLNSWASVSPVRSRQGNCKICSRSRIHVKAVNGELLCLACDRKAQRCGNWGLQQIAISIWEIRTHWARRKSSSIVNVFNRQVLSLVKSSFASYVT